MSELKYSYSFSELCDRMQIVLLKIIASQSDYHALENEVKDIMNDIQIHLDNKPMNAEMVKGLMVLGFVNMFIFGNETFVRDAGDNGNVDDVILLARLKDSHKANSLRAEAKKHIQNQRSERVDPKLNYGKSVDFWNIKW